MLENQIFFVKFTVVFLEGPQGPEPVNRYEPEAS